MSLFTRLPGLKLMSDLSGPFMRKSSAHAPARLLVRYFRRAICAPITADNVFFQDVQFRAGDHTQVVALKIVVGQVGLPTGDGFHRLAAITQGTDVPARC